MIFREDRTKNKIYKNNMYRQFSIDNSDKKVLLSFYFCSIIVCNLEETLSNQHNKNYVVIAANCFTNYRGSISLGGIAGDVKGMNIR